MLAPVPWFPLKGKQWGRYGVLAAVPAHEQRYGVEVLHSRYPVIPKIGMSVAPHLMAGVMTPVVRRLLAESDFDLIDAHYLYPDGVAAATVGARIGKPVVMTARGSDVNLIADYREPRRLILRAARDARALVTVSRALKDRLVAIGVPDERITVLRNGVDLSLFRPLDDRRSLVADNQLSLLSIGHLIEGKGHHYAIAALALLKNAHLTIVGAGPWRERLKRLAAESGVAQRVVFAGRVPYEELPRLYNAADILVLATRSEGMPNVVLEALACGTPVVVTPVGGAPELVAGMPAGRLMTERSAGALAQAVSLLADQYPDRAAVRRYAEQFSWNDTTVGQLKLFRTVIEDTRSGGNRDS